MIFKQVFDQKSSTYTYLIASAEGREALIIDPVLDQTSRDLDVLDKLGLTLKYIFETFFKNSKLFVED